MEELVLAQEELFQEELVEVWQDSQQNYFMTREQIGRALEYKNAQSAIKDIHKRNKKRMNKFSVRRKLRSTDGKEYETILYSKHGIYEICRKSGQPKADAFFDWVYSVLDALERGQLIWKKEREKVKETNISLREAIKDAGYTGQWDYSNFYDLIYKTAIGFIARQLRKERNADKKAVAADFMTAEELAAVDSREKEVITLLRLGLTRDEMKTIFERKGVLYQTTLKMPVSTK